jgi:hypothetical protein|tara:strand:- start:110 stop:352 length:243 start_codon:yes stop_codon:yes gene_type:complete
MEDKVGLLIGRVFLSLCALICLFAVLKAQSVSKWTLNKYKKWWKIDESSLPILTKVCIVWNSIGLVVSIYLLINLPQLLK